MEFATDAESLEKFSSFPARKIVKIICKNLGQWKELVKSLHVPTKDDVVLLAVIKVIGKICSEDINILEEDEKETGKDDEVTRAALVTVLLTVCNVQFFSLVNRKITTWTMVEPVKMRFSRNDWTQRNGQVLSCVLSLCEALLDAMPLTAKDVCANLVLTVIGIMKSDLLADQLPQIFCGFQRVNDNITSIIRQFEIEHVGKESRPKYGFTDEEELRMHEREPPSNFRKIPIVPTMKELLEDKRPFLRPCKQQGSYADAEHYLDVQFRLLREDFVQPIRKGLEEFLEYKDEYVKSGGRKRRNQNRSLDSSVRLYFNLQFREVETLINNTVNYTLYLPESTSRINWNKSKRLLSGNLVLLTSDFFQSAVFAIVVAPPFDPKESKDKGRAPEGSGDYRRAELCKGILRVSVETGEDLIDMSKSYIMLECESYFEAYRYNLDIIQKLNLSQFPLQSYIVFPDVSATKVAIPSYFLQKLGYMGNKNQDPSDVKIKVPYKVTVNVPVPAQESLSKPLDFKRSLMAYLPPRTEYATVSVGNLESWSSLQVKTQMGLDDNQYTAYRAALTSEFAAIQGPPGTGKTYIGLKIVETMLLNKDKSNPMRFSATSPQHGQTPRSPILVVCYTNHALDQFLELLVKLSPEMVRVGGQSKTKSLEQYTLPELRKQFRGRSSYFSGFNEIETQKNRVRETLRELENEENALLSIQGDIEDLSSFLGLIKFTSLNSTTYMMLKEMVPDSILNTVNDHAWLGLNGGQFQKVNFVVSYQLSSWFKMKNPSNNRPSRILETKTRNINAPLVSSRTQVTVEEVDEDYDMDELLEHRIGGSGVNFEDYEQVKFLLDQSRIRRRRDNLYYDGWPLKLYRAHILQYGDRIVQIEVLFRKHVEKEHENGKFNWRNWNCFTCIELRERLFETIESKREIENKVKFVVATFESYRNELLDLPNVEHLLRDSEFRTDISSDDDDIDNLFYTYVNIKGRKATATAATTTTMEKLGSMNMDERWASYFYCVNLAKEISEKLVLEVKQSIVEAKDKLKRQRNFSDGLILKYSDIIGMTTTGAAKHHDLLKIAQPEIVIIEEAAEILEAHTVTSLTEHCKHLILIGDHLQLRPSTNVYQLARKFHLDLSLFERMINNNMNLYSLKTQHRMRPEIAELIVGPIYDELHNHASVLNYPDVRGVAKNVFLIAHHEHEKTDNDIQSKMNEYEADFLTSFCDYLIKQGYYSSQITILTAYTGQMFLLKKKLQKACGRVRITCVDNFQGEENDIILLSLVRSNEENKIGFVGTDNRICVALSRAKHGLFITGNIESLRARSQTWNQIIEKLQQKGNCGDSLPLVCQRHSTITYATRGEDFTPLKSGGCTLQCDKKLKCDHLCPQLCHALDQDHTEYECRHRCEKLCNKNQHPCPSLCFEECPPCRATVTRPLPKCNHEVNMFCHQDPAEKQCPVIVDRKLPICGHEEPLPCYLDHTKYKCKRKVRRLLDCFHHKEMDCSTDEKTVKCKEMVEKVLVPCGHKQFVHCCETPEEASCSTEVDFVFQNCRHERKLKCSKIETATCVEKCQGVFPCGHKCSKTCHVTEDPNHEEAAKVCRKKCQRLCTGQEKHPCQNHPCSQPCPPCTTSVERVLPCDPSHTGLMLCHQDILDYKCVEKVVTKLSCGHTLKIECYKTLQLPLIKCSEDVEVLLTCGHKTIQKCGVSNEGTYCRELTLKTCCTCGHERHIVCSLQSTIGCLKEGCRQGYVIRKE